jgi:hypothetical protein
MEKGTNTDPINITTQKYANPVEIRISSNVEVQMMENPSVLTNKNLVINKATQVYEEDIIPKVNQENTTSMIRKIMLQWHLINIQITRVDTLTNLCVSTLLRTRTIFKLHFKEY